MRVPVQDSIFYPRIRGTLELFEGEAHYGVHRKSGRVWIHLDKFRSGIEISDLLDRGTPAQFERVRKVVMGSGWEPAIAQVQLARKNLEKGVDG